MRQLSFVASALVAVSLGTGCSKWDAREKGSQDNPVTYQVVDHVYGSPTSTATAPGQSCGTYQVYSRSSSSDGTYYQSLEYCSESKEQRWQAQCDQASCAKTSVFVHYGLAQDLADGMTVAVEAFDNASFNGTPVAATQLFGFPAHKGEWRQADLYLPAGRYYVRAYMTNDSGARLPYVLSDMKPLKDKDQTALGAVGVLSDAQALTVGGGADAGHTVDLVLDQLLQRPGSAPDTNAQLRLELKVADVTTVTTGRDVLVELRDQESLDARPVYSFKIPSDQLLVKGREGQVEFVTPSLAPGNYTVFAFVDANGNGFPDAAELQGLYKQAGAVKMLEVRKDTTRTVELALAVPTK